MFFLTGTWSITRLVMFLYVCIIVCMFFFVLCSYALLCLLLLSRMLVTAFLPACACVSRVFSRSGRLRKISDGASWGACVRSFRSPRGRRSMRGAMFFDRLRTVGEHISVVSGMMALPRSAAG